MKPVGDKVLQSLGSFACALRASEKEPSAVADVEEFLALLNESPRDNVSLWRTGMPQKLPVCVHWQRAIESAQSEPSRTLAETLDALRDELVWVQSEGYVRSPPSANFLDNYGYAVIAGPPDLVPAPLSINRLAAGLILLGPQTHYPLHRHPAIELYYVVSGRAEWWRGDGPWQMKPPGALIYHDTEVPHGMRTAKEPLVAAYLWKGDLHTDAYFVE
jgi:mannose-6-phosphate isomerase-like protein (cupin superfamily)